MGMLPIRHALRDMGRHRLLNLLTVVTVALTILILGAAGLVFLNLSDLLDNWKNSVRITAYLAEDLSQEAGRGIGERIRGLEGVASVRFIPRAEALSVLRSQLTRQGAILDHLEENPLPDAFEIRMAETSQGWDGIEGLARRLEGIQGIDDVEYGQRWVHRFSHVFDLFRLTGATMSLLLVTAALFIVGNTVRLVFYSRREEVEIMRLVGATERFILTPFYLLATFQGLMGGVVGIAGLYGLYSMVSARVATTGWMSLRFLPVSAMAVTLIVCMLVGGLGCHLSLRRHFAS